jgi:NAD+ synthase (glutamine-hydrolysing)
MSYAELGVFGYLRKVLRCGPVKMFLRLSELWKHLAPAEVAVKVRFDEIKSWLFIQSFIFVAV